MRGALIAVSKKGAELANDIKNFTDFDVYINKKYSENFNKIFFYEKLSDLVAKIFKSYDAIVFISAAQIAVRMIAPHIKNKLYDPAIVVMDELGKYAISLLSGHIGGANFLAKRLAKITGGEAIVTTATDAHNLIAPDLIAPVLGMNLFPKSAILKINNAILDGKNISYFIDKNLIHAEFYKAELKKFDIESKIVNSLNFDENYSAFFTDKPGNFENVLYMIPQKLIAGVGCRKGVKKEIILNALSDAAQKIGKDLSFINLITSTVAKQNEKGILDAAEELKIEVKFFSNEDLQKIIYEYRLKESEFVRKNIGVGNVSEAAALAGAKCGKFALNKTKYEKVTVALVWEKSL